MDGDQNHNNRIKGSPELTLLRLWETSLKYVKTKVETKVEQSGTWLKAPQFIHESFRSGCNSSAFIQHMECFTMVHIYLFLQIAQLHS
jgi:hypothetical protein